MYSEAKKLNLIKHLLKEKNEEVLMSIEAVLMKPAKTAKNHFDDFKSILTNEEADEMSFIIEEGCEKIDEADWK